MPTERFDEVREEIVRLIEKEGLTHREVANRLGFATRQSVLYYLNGPRRYKSVRSDRLTLAQRRFLGAIMSGKSDREAARVAGATNDKEIKKMIADNEESKPFNDALEKVTQGTELSEEWLLEKVIEMIEFEKPYTVYESGRRKTVWALDPSSRKAGLEILNDLRDRIAQRDAETQQIIVQTSGLEAILKHSGKTLDQLLESGKIKYVEVVQDKEPQQATLSDGSTESY